MKIQCPKCSQRFDVTEEFKGKTVECGSCDHRFKVTEDVAVTEKDKFYPGEKRGVHLERFANPDAKNESRSVTEKVGFAKAQYQPNVNAESVGPPSPRRTIAAIVGVSLMVFVIVLFLLAGGKTGAMRDMEITNRFILVGFTAVLGCALVFYGMVQNRIRAVLLCFILGSGLLALPVFFPGNPLSESSGDREVAAVAEGMGESSVSGGYTEGDYLHKIGYFPVAEALDLAPKKSVAAIYIRNASMEVRSAIAEYLYVKTGKLDRGTSYNRGDMSEAGLYGLILMVKQEKSLDEIAVLCERFSKVNDVHHELRVIDVTVDGSKVVTLDPKKSSDPSSQEFFYEQLKALKSFDSAVNMTAAKCLAGSEPKAMRDDITKQMLEMLPASQNDLKVELILALQVWSKPGDGADMVVLKAVQDLHKVGLVGKPAMDFLIDRQVEGSELVLMDLWNADPAAWSDQVQRLGDGAQVLLLPLLKDMDVVHLVAAADILGEVGTDSSIPYIESVIETKEEVGQKSLKAAIDEIKKRS